MKIDFRISETILSFFTESFTAPEIKSSLCETKEPLSPTDLKIAFEELARSGKFQGIALVSKGEELIFQNASGIAFEGTSQSIQLNSQFLIGSLSKQFTAAALLKALSLNHPSLRDLKTSLHTPLATYLQQEHRIWAGKMPEWAHQTTLHQLLTHTSGIPNFTDNPAFQEKLYQDPHPPEELLSLVKHQSLLFKPGSGVDYSNTNYLLLAAVVEEISKQPFEQFLEHHFFSPLQMHSTAHPAQGNLEQLQKREPFRKLIDALPAQPHIDLSNAFGCGGMISTAEDLFKWNMALHVHQSVLSPDIYSLMMTDYTSNSEGDGEGYGIGIQQLSTGEIYGHQGRLDTFNGMLLFCPQNQTTLLLLSNSDEGYASLTDVLDRTLA